MQEQIHEKYDSLFYSLNFNDIELFSIFLYPLLYDIDKLVEDIQ